ncbi:MAG: hypothetical protein LQ340_003032 [Diploschistes diacapsis]|nr:MAG: hypothetical protein LQ340_003032 [Diploschistes diacapsis]
MHLLGAFLVLLATSTGYYIYSFTTCYAAARKIGLPILLTPVTTKNILWLLFGPPLHPLLQQILPQWLFLRIEMSLRGRESRLGNKARSMVGQSFLLVGPGTLELWTTDAEMIKTITGHGTFRNYPQSKILQVVSGIFGPTVVGSNGEDWQRQRRIIAPTINERISATVWKESIEQAWGMLDHFAASSGEVGSAGVTDRSLEGLRRIAINVLSASAYGTPRGWSEENEQAPAGYKLGFINSLQAISANFAAAIFLPPILFNLPFLSSDTRKVGIAMEEFPRYVTGMLERERASADTDHHSITSAMIKASDNYKQDAPSHGDSRLHLSDPELRGNLFLFTIAGYDTTANTMGYALTFLAIHPDVQAWVVEEIDRVCASLPTAQTPNQATSMPAYETAFPRLKRCLALMLETLRLHPPTASLARTTASPQTITTSSGTTHPLPSGLDVFVFQAGAHIDPDYWAPDPLVFRPSRWILPTTNSSTSPSEKLEEETLFEPAKGTYLPWSFGPRHCPGMKMAQVEFVSVFATLLRHVRVEAVVLPGEKGVEEARRRLEGVVADSGPVITVQIRRPRDVVLRWVRREGGKS